MTGGINVSAAAGPQTITAHAADGAGAVNAVGYLWTTLRNLTQSGIDYLIGLLQQAGFFIPEGLDLGNYITTASKITDTHILAYASTGTATWPDVSPQVAEAFTDALALGVNVVAPRLRGAYFIDPSHPALVGTGFIGPLGGKCQLAYIRSGSTLRERLNNTGLTFLVDTQSGNRMVPKFALRGGVTVKGLQIVGIGLAAQAANIDTSDYPDSIAEDALLDAAPVICTDHRHDENGALLELGDSSKAGGVSLDCHIVGVMRGVYLGDPLPQEEPWAYEKDADGNVIYVTVNVGGVPTTIGKGITASGLQTGMSFTSVKITASTMYRVLGVARSTAGGLNADIQAIPPYATIISQPNSGGLTNYALLKYFQQYGRVVDGWHRWVGFNVNVQARGFRFGAYLQAGYNEQGPAGQDTGKYNGGTFAFGVERVITLVYVHTDSYLHRVKIVCNGHVMDEYNLKGEHAPMIDIQTDAEVAGAIDKAVYDPVRLGDDYSIDDKVGKYVTVDGVSSQIGVWSCQAPGNASLVPDTADADHYSTVTKRFTDPSIDTTDPTNPLQLVWIWRNGGFKPLSENAFARFEVSGVLSEISGSGFKNTVNDGHVQVAFDKFSPGNWSQAKGHHDEACIINASPTMGVKHINSETYATANSKRVYDMADLQMLHVGGNDYYGYDLTKTPDQQAQAIGGGAMLDAFFDGTNCNIHDFNVAAGDDNTDDPGTD